MSTTNPFQNNKSDVSNIPIAIVGMSCRLPGSKNLEEFWDLVASGGDATGELPEDVLNRELYFDPNKGTRGKSYSSVGGLTPRVPFDNQKCRLSEAEIEMYDIAHLNMCEVAADALINANYDPFHLATKNTGVYFGHTGGSTKAGDLVYAVYIEQITQYLHGLKALSHLGQAEIQEISEEIISNVRSKYGELTDPDRLSLGASVGAELIVKAYGLDGPCVVIDAACASSHQALMLAFRALQQGNIEMAIAGGASYCKSDSLVLFSQAQSVTTGSSRPFDRDANGLVSSEGYVTFVLKTLPKAIADGDNIRAVIRSIGISTDGKGKSLWAPRSEGQILAMERAYSNGISPEDVQYVEAHATSTQVGDETELTAMASVFTDKIPAGKKIPLGSVKANIGHTLESAGASSLAKTILAMEHGVIPPVANLENPNPAVPWEKLPFYLPRVAEPWNRPAEDIPRRAAVNAFGIGGLNVHIIVEEFLPGNYPTESNQKTPLEIARKSNGQEGIAVIGTGAILPGAHSIEAFWDLVVSGKDTKTDISMDRWNGNLYLDPEPGKPYRCTSLKGGFVTDYTYDWRRHKVPPKQIQNANPLQFMLLDATEQAMKQAGYPSNHFDPQNTGVVVGTMFGGEFSNQLQAGLRLPEFSKSLKSLLWSKSVPDNQIDKAITEFSDKLLKEMPALIDETGSFTSSTLASRITKTFDLKGGALSLEAGCGSGLAALSACVDILNSGACNVMICAAGQRSMDVIAFERMSRSGSLGTGDPKKDAQDNLYTPGEGSSVLILKRLSDAKRDGDKVLGVIRGVATSVNFDKEGQSLQPSMDRPIDKCKVTLEETSGIETFEYHGCDNNLNYTSHATNSVSVPSKKPLHESTLISQFGDMGATLPIASVIKACLAFEHGSFPLNDDRRSIKLNSSAAIGISCGSDTGSEYHTIVESVNRVSKSPKIESNNTKNMISSKKSLPKVIRVGAKDWNSLQTLVESMSANQAYSSVNQFKPEHRVRLAIVSDNPEDFKSQYQFVTSQAWGSEQVDRVAMSLRGIYFGKLNNTSGKCAFVFPGQGSAYTGMLNSLIEVVPSAQKACRQVDSAMNALGYETFSQIAGPDSQQDLGRDLWKSQISMLLSSYIMNSCLSEMGLRPSVLAGHSFGEYAALVSSGAWSLTDAIRCTHYRYLAIRNSSSAEGVMAATNAPVEKIRSILKMVGQGVYIANYNAPDQTIISGQKQAVENALSHFKKQKLIATKINVPAPFHTPLMQASADEFTSQIDNILLRSIRCPIVSTATSEVITEPDQLKNSLVAQLCSPVNYSSMLDKVLETQPDLVIEVGPNQVLTRLNRKNHAANDVVFLSTDNPQKNSATMLYGAIAQADCLGILEGNVPQIKNPSKFNENPIEFDATERRRNKMRNKSEKKESEKVFSRSSNGIRTQSPDSTNNLVDTTTRQSEITTDKPNRVNQSMQNPLLPSNETSQDTSRPEVTIQHQAMALKNKEKTQSHPSAEELERVLIEFVVDQTG
ncbi:MAG: beta-ketoacyl synthase N-terminal-like domain-containing protein, partial [Pirellulales bacterium]